jgi:hypothetical protein
MHPGQRDQRERRDDLHHGGGKDDTPPIDVIGRVSGERREDEDRREDRESDESEIERAVAQRVDLPRDRDALDLRCQIEREKRGEVKAKGV